MCWALEDILPGVRLESELEGIKRMVIRTAGPADSVLWGLKSLILRKDWDQIACPQCLKECHIEQGLALFVTIPEWCAVKVLRFTKADSKQI